MARRESDGKAIKDGVTIEETGSLEEKTPKVPEKAMLLKMSKEIVKSRSRKSAARRTRPTNDRKEPAVFKSPVQEVTEKSGKGDRDNKNLKAGARKPSVEKLEPTGSRLPSPSMQQTTPLSDRDIASVEDQLNRMTSFHGLICREDVNMLLKKPGDWLMRISVLANEKKPKKDLKTMSSKEAPVTPVIKNQKVIVVSVFPVVKKLPPGQIPKFRVPIRHLSIRISKGLAYLDKAKRFKSIQELITYYSNNVGNDRGADFQLLNSISLTNWEFHHEEVELLEKKLGEGAFGEVRVGKMKTKESEKMLEVAVKTLKNPDKEPVSREQVSELLHEARVMRLLDHTNVLKSYGVAVLKEPLYLMSELCNCGALREYLKENKKTITLEDKLNFVLGSARGVEYLHSQRLIHRDLAVRNILLTDDKTPKVSDFGLAKQTERYEMREACKIPVRYLAPETLEVFIFTAKSDVFSFGCVIWEIYENGLQPHDGKNGQTIRSLNKKREFLKLSPSAPEELRRVVSERVFVADPENRCSMTTIVQCAEKLVKSDGSGSG